jgi:hypothetical protein
MEPVEEEAVQVLPEALVALVAVPGVPVHKLQNRACTLRQL